MRFAEAVSSPIMNSRCPSRSSRGRAFSMAERIPPASTKSLRSRAKAGSQARCGDVILATSRVLLGDTAGNVGADRARGDVDGTRGENGRQSFTPERRRGKRMFVGKGRYHHIAGG